VTDDLRHDLENIADNHQVLKEDEFKRIFWEQQVDLVPMCECLHCKMFSVLGCCMESKEDWS